MALAKIDIGAELGSDVGIGAEEIERAHLDRLDLRLFVTELRRQVYRDFDAVLALFLDDLGERGREVEVPRDSRGIEGGREFRPAPETGSLTRPESSSSWRSARAAPRRHQRRGVSPP